MRRRYFGLHRWWVDGGGALLKAMSDAVGPEDYKRIIGRDMWHIQEQLKGTAARKYLKRETRDEWTDKTRNFIKILGLRLSSWLSIYIFGSMLFYAWMTHRTEY